MTFSARIIILNYNGESLLPKCLPSIVKAAASAQTPTRITVLDNLSQDASKPYVKDHFPQVDYVTAPENLILCSYNDYLARISETVAILLNNDIRVDPDFVDPLVDPFRQNPKTFLVAPRVMDFSGEHIESAKTVGRLKYGIFWCTARYPGYEREALLPSKTLSAGFGAFSRELFLKLGGYDKRFLPGIFEDVDLCFRARKEGYDLRYEPRSIVYHVGQASFKKTFGSFKISRLAYRNNFLFLWKNFDGPAFWLYHLFFIPFRTLYAFLRGDRAFPLGLGDALAQQFKNKLSFRK